MRWKHGMCLLGALVGAAGGAAAPDAKQMAGLWKALAGKDAVAAAAAADRLVAAGDPAVELIAGRLHKAVPAAQEIAGLVRKLGDPAWSVRDGASKALVDIGLPAEAQLREAIKSAESEEARNRAAGILSRFADSGHDHPRAVLFRRAAAVLGRIGSDRAAGALRGLPAAAPCLEARHRCRRALRDIADRRIRSLLKDAESSCTSARPQAATALCRRALAAALEADDFRARQIKRIIEHLASPKTVPKDLWRLPTVDALELPDGITLRLVLVPAGKFVMGSTYDEIGRESDEGPRREVTISSAFFMGMFEVTQEQYQAVMGDNPSHYKGRLDPVHRETWFEATAFCQKLSKRTGRAVRLPTEAEWEYACRAGTTTPFNTGRTLTAEHANYDGRMPYGADRPSRFRGRTAPVGSYRPNAWGLYDMHGNVWEWCSDWHSHSYAGAADVDPKGAPRGRVRILRGGAWSYDANGCRSADRGYQLPDARSVNFGFRVAVDSDRED